MGESVSASVRLCWRFGSDRRVYAGGTLAGDVPGVSQREGPAGCPQRGPPGR